MQTSLLLGFVGVALVAYLVPGPDWLMVMRGATTGAWHGTVTGLGTQAGLLVHGLLATAGVSALIAAAPAALVVIQLLGAVYLLYLGVAGLRQPVAAEGAAPIGWREAFVTNLSNPKVIVFFAAVAPQFVAREHPVWPQMLLLTVIDVVLGILWWAALAVVLSPLAGRIGPARINTVASALLVLVAVGLLGYTIAEHVA
ncbi:LysE family translocator [Nocardia sp. NPDC050697]|uniref:LysE family translocator n=1 Tax=Nocardia sp. NPDC050697 TaxID=3155158 RepID=UPI0033EBE70B